MKITTRKLAEAAGVSPASVSRYFNGTEAVSDDIAARIEEAVKLLGGEEIGRKSRKKLILLLLTHMSLPFFSEAVEEFLKRDDEYTFLLLRCDSNAPEMVKRLVSRMKPTGAIYFEEELDPALLGILRSGGIRMVMCGGITQGQTSDMVRVNDIAAAYDGASYLLGLGHRDILFLSDEMRKIGAGYKRVVGCRKAMEEHGLTITDEMLRCIPLTFEAGYEAVNDALARKLRFTAIFAFCDEVAVGAMAALHDAGLSVPEDVSVLGFDDLKIAAKVRPALTTVRQPIEAIVKKTMELLCRSEGDLRAELLLPHCVVERESCRRLNG